MSETRYKYLIIGNGAAAIHAAEAIRKADAAGSLAIVARESEHTYSRPLITYRLGGKVADGGMDYRAKDFYTSLNIQAHLGVEVSEIDTTARTVTCIGSTAFSGRGLEHAQAGKPVLPNAQAGKPVLPNAQVGKPVLPNAQVGKPVLPNAQAGEPLPNAQAGTRTGPCTIGFEKLLLATGGAPIRPAAPGLNAQGVFTFTTWADQRAVERFIGENNVKAPLVLGGGLIGLKTVEALVERKLPVHLVELADRILAVTFDQDASRLAQKSLSAAGVQIHTGVTLARTVVRGGCVCGAELTDGSSIECDMIILAIGVKPDLTLAAGTNIACDRGILVDDHMATNIAGIYAAGDVAQGLDALSGQRRPIPILPAAARQGRIAGANMAGGDKSYGGGVAMNAVDVVGLPTISVGITVGQQGDEVLVRLDEEANVYRKLVIRNNRLIGAIFIGNIERAGVFTGLIRTRLDVGAFKALLLSDEFGLLSLPADYRAHMVSGAGIEV
jgi:NAD(P)H-nitrite reductase large subunit